MDLTEDVTYRGFLLNDKDIADTVTSSRESGSGIRGCVIDSVDWGEVDVIQFREPKAQEEGVDTGEPALGARRVVLTGTLYAPSRDLLFDDLQSLRAALAPRLAWLDEPSDMGFQPLYFSRPTARADDYPALVIPLRVLAMPYSLKYVLSRRQHGGVDTDALAIPWVGSFLMRDPRIFAVDPTDNEFTGSESGNVVNRGDYPATLNILFEVDALSGSLSFSIGGATFTITVPTSTGVRVFRYKGQDNILTVEEDSVEEMRLDLITWTNQSGKPSIPPGTSAYSISKSGTMTLSGSGASHFWFWEAYA